MYNKIICAAIHSGNITILGIRHFDNLMRASVRAQNLEHLKHSEWIQGFVDRYGEFHNREEAMLIVKKNEQIINFGRNGGNEFKLYSEGLY